MKNMYTYFFPSIANFEYTPSDWQMYPYGYMYSSLGTLDLDVEHSTVWCVSVRPCQANCCN